MVAGYSNVYRFIKVMNLWAISIDCDETLYWIWAPLYDSWVSHIQVVHSFTFPHELISNRNSGAHWSFWVWVPNFQLQPQFFVLFPTFIDFFFGSTHKQIRIFTSATSRESRLMVMVMQFASMTSPWNRTLRWAPLCVFPLASYLGWMTPSATFWQEICRHSSRWPMMVVTGAKHRGCVAQRNHMLECWNPKLDAFWKIPNFE